jgi:hypothetical protein
MSDRLTLRTRIADATDGKGRGRWVKGGVMRPRSLLGIMLVANLCSAAVAILVAVVLRLDRLVAVSKIVVSACGIGFSVVVAVTLLLTGSQRR